VKVSRRVRERLRRLGVLHTTTHGERLELDRIIEEKTGKDCDEGVDLLSDGELLLLLREARRGLRRKPPKRAVTMVV